MQQVKLRVVEAPEKSMAAMLLELTVPVLIEAEATVTRLRAMVEQHGRELAKERGIGFVRVEQLKAEFGR